MANHKRHKPRTKVRCTICTPNRYGNMEKGQPIAVRRQNQKDRIDRLM